MKGRFQHPNIDNPPRTTFFNGDLLDHYAAVAIDFFLNSMGISANDVRYQTKGFVGWSVSDAEKGIVVYLSTSRDYTGRICISAEVWFAIIPPGSEERAALLLLRSNASLIAPVALCQPYGSFVAVAFKMHDEFLSKKHLQHRLPWLLAYAIFCKDSWIGGESGLERIPESFFSRDSSDAA